MSCFDGYGSQEGLESHYRRHYAGLVLLYVAYSPDRRKHFTLLLDATDNSMGLVLPGKDEVDEWYTDLEVQPEGGMFDGKLLGELLSQVPQDYSLEALDGSRVVLEEGRRLKPAERVVLAVEE